MNYILIMAAMVVAAMCGAIGQIALRLAADRLGHITPLSVLTNWPLYVFGASYAVAVIINIWAYKAGGKTSIIYPVIALSYIFASLIAWKWLGEAINGWVWAGSITIVVGVAIIGYGGAL